MSGSVLMIAICFLQWNRGLVGSFVTSGTHAPRCWRARRRQGGEAADPWRERASGSLAGANNVSRAGPALVVVHDTGLAIAGGRTSITSTEPIRRILWTRRERRNMAA